MLDPTARVDLGWLQEPDRKGIIGVRLNLVRTASAFDYDAWPATLAAVEKMGWHIELRSEAEYLPEILPQLTRHREKIVIDHFVPEFPTHCVGCEI
ncbi:hypothetical protein [Phaeobacter sp. C3_T13_0]|uniref:hypothetical protein n=1 Tax=Phaeobacter cretensis TaxID=3342641 RepID=UPI0039BD2800